ncbi:MAG TPA: hypothetical protein VJT71_13270 [Pyrinomonadaceae bacterium]|nr:hypothetical protein [Pyrinomonadaceae bacterium]
MPVLKKRDHQTESRLLLESADPIDLPPAEIADNAVLVQFEKLKPFIPELLDELRAGTTAEPVPVMNDGSTFAIHGATRTFWVKLWHAAGSELGRVERAQVISCLIPDRVNQAVQVHRGLKGGVARCNIPGADRPGKARIQLADIVRRTLWCMLRHVAIA